MSSRELTTNDMAEILKDERTKIDTYRKDIQFLSIALNLSGNRDKLEDEAMKLIESEGYIGAIKISNAKQKEDFANVSETVKPCETCKHYNYYDSARLICMTCKHDNKYKKDLKDNYEKA